MVMNGDKTILKVPATACLMARKLMRTYHPAKTILSQSTRETTGRNVLLAFHDNDNIDSMTHLNVGPTKGFQSFSITMHDGTDVMY